MAATDPNFHNFDILQTVPNACILRIMGTYRGLTREEERALITKAQAGDQRAAATLLQRFYPLIKKAA